MKTKIEKRKMNMKKKVALIMAFAVSFSMMTACNKDNNDNASNTKAPVEAQTSDEGEEKTTIRIGGLSGPTSMGLVKLMEDSASDKLINTYEFAQLSTDPSTFVAPLAKGEIDIAAVPSNLASVIYNKTQGQVVALAVNTLCVLDIVERGEDVQSIADLKGKTIYATGQGATPEYTLKYILSKNDLEAQKDVTIQWCADTTEALSYITKDDKAIAMLPQPFVTVAMSKVEGLRVALDLNDEWNKVNDECKQVTGVIVARKEFVDEYPNQVQEFLDEYKKSIEYLDTNPDESAELIEKYGIVPSAIAKQAIPKCHIVYEIKDEMKTSLGGFLSVLYDANPASIGGKLPEDDFYR